jgi:phytoene synthase
VGSLDAAGITDPALRASYRHCRALNAAHGRTYYLATLLLPAAKRPAVHALYAFARYADDLVDELDRPLPAHEAARRLDALEAGLAGPVPDEPQVLAALRDTVARWGVPVVHLHDFLAAMRMDLTVTGYATFDDLLGYTHGSAGVIGLQLLPVLGTVVPAAVAAPYAHDLGTGFQLVNFVRDVGEDLRRGRVYLPAEELAAHGVSRQLLGAGRADPRVRALLQFQVARARRLLFTAELGVRLLDPTSRDCVRTALVLYGGILDAVERSGYRVLDQRAAVGPARRLTVAGAALVRARRARALSSAARADPTTPTTPATG